MTVTGRSSDFPVRDPSEAVGDELDEQAASGARRAAATAARIGAWVNTRVRCMGTSGTDDSAVTSGPS